MHSLQQSVTIILSLYLHLHNISAEDMPLPDLNIYCALTNLHQLHRQRSLQRRPEPVTESSNHKHSMLRLHSHLSWYQAISTYKVNSLFLCRGDLNSTECSMCITSALANVQKYCPFAKNATLFFNYGECFLLYSHKTSFGEIDNEKKISYYEVTENGTLPSGFSSHVTQMMSSLRGKVSSPLLFATEVRESVMLEEKLYGLVQCNRDLSAEDCDTCLEILIDKTTC